MQSMTASRRAGSREAEAAWPDSRLVRECLAGSEQAWSALIDKYKNLIYSVPIRYGFGQEDAADIFQAVCLELLAELPRLRNPQALPAWLMQVASHRCFHGKRQQQRYVSGEEAEERFAALAVAPEPAEKDLQEAEQEQKLREALRELSPRCRQLIEMLFFEQPARPYLQIAQSLGIATGSIGFIRGRCLERLRRQLGRMGFA
jgi:RNA polymerase sigma factor (sigma-70 family)